MNTETDKQIAEATQIVKDAVAEFGLPVWVVRVPMRIRRLVPAKVKSEILKDAPVSKGWYRDVDGSYAQGRPDNKGIVLAWAKENIYRIVTTKEISEATGVPIHTVRTLVTDRPDIFRDSDGWTYEIRDPQADRKAQKK